MCHSLIQCSYPLYTAVFNILLTLLARCLLKNFFFAAVNQKSLVDTFCIFDLWQWKNKSQRAAHKATQYGRGGPRGGMQGMHPPGSTLCPSFSSDSGVCTPPWADFMPLLCNLWDIQGKVWSFCFWFGVFMGRCPYNAAPLPEQNLGFSPISRIAIMTQVKLIKNLIINYLPKEALNSRLFGLPGYESWIQSKKNNL